MKVLVLCHGNINRSPLAEAVLHYRGWAVRSAGFKPGGGRAAKKMRDWVAENLPDCWPSVEAHTPTLVTPELVRWADVVLLMDGGNLKRFEALFGKLDKVQMLGSYVGLPRIPDPGFMSRGDPKLGTTYALVAEAAATFAKKNWMRATRT